MGTNFKDGKKPKNRITISRGGEVPARKINPAGGEADRSFAQPNPAVPERKIEPKVHANMNDEAKAMSKNSKLGKNYNEQDENNE